MDVMPTAHLVEIYFTTSRIVIDNLRYSIEGGEE